MVVDTSALIAILEQEADAAAMAEALGAVATRLVSAATLLETSMVVASRRGAPGLRELDLLIQKLAVQVVPVTEEHAEVGRQAFLSYGKGRHPAGLNYGDCFVYACSFLSGEPILCTGDDFPRTDAAIVGRPREPR